MTPPTHPPYETAYSEPWGGLGPHVALEGLFHLSILEIRATLRIVFHIQYGYTGLEQQSLALVFDASQSES